MKCLYCGFTITGPGETNHMAQMMIHVETNHPDRYGHLAKAIKYDDDKPQMHFLPPAAIVETAKVFTFGAKKYAAYNYRNGKGLDWTRVADAAQRHLQAWMGGEDLDPETGLSHLAHMTCCSLMLMDLQKRNKGVDDRPKYESRMSI